MPEQRPLFDEVMGVIVSGDELVTREVRLSGKHAPPAYEPEPFHLSYETPPNDPPPYAMHEAGLDYDGPTDS